MLRTPEAARVESLEKTAPEKVVRTEVLVRADEELKVPEDAKVWVTAVLKTLSDEKVPEVPEVMTPVALSDESAASVLVA